MEVLETAKGTGMTFERSYMNWEEGLGICCWSADSKDDLAKLFEKAGTPYDKIIPVEEHAAETLLT